MNEQNTMKEVVNTISGTGVLYRLKISKPSFKTRLSFAELGIPDISNVATPSAMRLIDKERIAPFDKISGRMRAYLAENSLEGIGGLRFVNWSNFKKVKSTIDNMIIEWSDELEKFAIDYEQNLQESVSEWRTAAGLVWDSSSELSYAMSKESYVNSIEQKVRARWPSRSELKKRFAVTQTCAQFSNQIVGSADASMIAEAQEVANQEVKSFVEEAMLALRKKTAEMCVHVKEVMENSGTIHEKSLEPLRKWVKQFRELNFLDDVACKNFLDDLDMFLVSGSAYTMQEDFQHMSDFKDLLDSASDLTKEITDDLVSEQLDFLSGKKVRKLNVG